MPTAKTKTQTKTSTAQAIELPAPPTRPTREDRDRAISAPELAAELGLALSTVQRWCTHGVAGYVLPSFYWGAARYVERRAVDAFMAALQTPRIKRGRPKTNTTK